jgi:CDP-diacylglycerol---serine O-phosphatidyltransferase
MPEIHDDPDEPARAQGSGPVLRPPRRRAIFLLPNLFTTGTVFAGFYGIVAAIDGNYRRAAIAIVIAAILDGLDGRLARLTRTESEFGKQYDSLADMVAFGLAPALIAYQWGLGSLAEYGWAWGKLGWLVAFLYAVAAALRLARFNVMPPSTDRRFFEGLPSPSAAGFVVTLVWLLRDQSVVGLGGLVAGLLVTFSAATLMVSRFAYFSFKQIGSARQPGGALQIGARSRIPFTWALLIPVVFALIAIDPPSVMFLIAFTYALSGPVGALWRRRRRRNRRLPAD